MNGNTEEVKQALVEAGDRGLSLLEMVEMFPKRSRSSLSTLMENWMRHGYISRCGRRGSYHYCYTGKEFALPSRGRRCVSSDSYERIYVAVRGCSGEWFTSVSLARKLQIEQSVVCNCLAKLFRDQILERRGVTGPFEYRQMAALPPYRFPKGEIPDLLFRVLQEADNPLSIDNASLVVSKLRSQAGRNGHPHWRYRNAVRKVVEGWVRHGHLIVTHEDGVAHYELVAGITERPLSLAR